MMGSFCWVTRHSMGGQNLQRGGICMKYWWVGVAAKDTDGTWGYTHSTNHHPSTHCAELQYWDEHSVSPFNNHSTNLKFTILWNSAAKVMAAKRVMTLQVGWQPSAGMCCLQSTWEKSLAQMPERFTYSDASEQTYYWIKLHFLNNHVGMHRITYNIVTNSPLILKLTYPNTLGPPPHLDHLHCLSLKQGILADNIVYLSVMLAFKIYNGHEIHITSNAASSKSNPLPNGVSLVKPVSNWSKQKSNYLDQLPNPCHRSFRPLTSRFCLDWEISTIFFDTVL